MKKTLLLAAALMVVTATVASAQFQRGTLSLGWANCRVNGLGVGNATFACNTNGGAGARLVGGFIPAQPLNSLNSGFLYVDVFTESPALDPWWTFTDATPGCRPLTTWALDLGNAAGVTCDRTYWPDAGSPSSASRYFMPTYQANHATLRILVAVDAGQAASIPQANVGEEMHAFSAVLGRGLSTGAGSCAGCLTHACLAFTGADLFQTNNDNFTVGGATINSTQPLIHPTPGNAYVSWQGGAGAPPCTDPTAARNGTWGAIKSMYR
jgi:hypothetical protein